jgi:ABC1 atypical kinase-like domain
MCARLLIHYYYSFTDALLCACELDYYCVHANNAKVLTMERLRGVPLTDLEAIKECTDNPEGALIAALNTWTRSVMACSFFHADVSYQQLVSLHCFL